MAAPIPPLTASSKPNALATIIRITSGTPPMFVTMTSSAIRMYPIAMTGTMISQAFAMRWIPP